MKYEAWLTVSCFSLELLQHLQISHELWVINGCILQYCQSDQASLETEVCFNGLVDFDQFQFFFFFSLIVILIMINGGPKTLTPLSSYLSPVNWKQVRSYKYKKKWVAEHRQTDNQANKMKYVGNNRQSFKPRTVIIKIVL